MEDRPEKEKLPGSALLTRRIEAQLQFSLLFKNLRNKGHKISKSCPARKQPTPKPEHGFALVRLFTAN